MKNLTKKLSGTLIGSLLTLGIGAADADAQCLFRGGNQASFRRDYGYSHGGYSGGGYSYGNRGNVNVAIPYYNNYVPSPQPVFSNFQEPNPTIGVKIPEGYTAYVTDPNGRTYAVSYDGYPNSGSYGSGYNVSQPQYYQENQNYAPDVNQNGIDDRQEYYQQNPNYAPDVNQNGIDDRRESYYQNQNYLIDQNNNGVDDRQEYYQGREQPYYPRNSVQGYYNNGHAYYGPGPVRGVVGGSVIVAGSLVEGVGVVGRVVGQGVEVVGAGVENLGRGTRNAGERIYYQPQRVNHPYRY